MNNSIENVRWLKYLKRVLIIERLIKLNLYVDLLLGIYVLNYPFLNNMVVLFFIYMFWP